MILSVRRSPVGSYAVRTPAIRRGVTGRRALSGRSRDRTERTVTQPGGSRATRAGIARRDAGKASRIRGAVPPGRSVVPSQRPLRRQSHRASFARTIGRRRRRAGRLENRVDFSSSCFKHFRKLNCSRYKNLYYINNYLYRFTLGIVFENKNFSSNQNLK